MQNTQYPSDLTDTEWKILQPLLPPRHKRGRPPTDRRLVLNAIRYVLRSGCAWRMLPPYLYCQETQPSGIQS